MVYYFLEGGAFMWPILLTLVFGLGFVLERAYSLMMSGVNSDSFFEAITTSINEDGTEAAKEICQKTDGPVAAIFHAGLSKLDRGHDETEKAIQNAGGIEMAFLEKNMIWHESRMKQSLFIRKYVSSTIDRILVSCSTRALDSLL